MTYLEKLNNALKTREGLSFLTRITKEYCLEYLFLFEIVDWLRRNAERLDCVEK